MEVIKFLSILLYSFIFTSAIAEEVKPIIKQLHIHTDIKFTYAKTYVFSRILNPADAAQEVSFRVVLPEEAFITGLTMTIKDKSYDAYVKGKEEAKKEYDQAVSSGQGAAHVFQDPTRNSKDFFVSVNVEPHDKVNFNLTYEELLSRKMKTYTNEINVNPQQIVPDLKVIVDIEDILDIINVRIPKFKMGNEIDIKEEENKAAKITNLAQNKVRVEWNPTTEEQTELNKDGLNGQMVVKYDVDASKHPQQVLVGEDGYFVHILRNDSLPVLNKHVVFVLDVSGSMSGRKIDQLKDALSKILNDLSEDDHFSIVLFSVKVIAWGPTEGADLKILDQWDSLEPANIIPKDDYVVPATKKNIDAALNFTSTLSSYGGTNIMGGLRNGLTLAKLGKKLHANAAVPEEAMIIFLTDGQPNSEESSTDKIIENIEKTNNGVTIFSLGFGTDFDLDFDFLKKLSLGSNGFARRIYPDSDASLQLQNFFKEVASPLLSDIKFEYLPDQVEETTSDGFKNLFLGSDLSVLGKSKSPDKVPGAAVIAICGTGLERFPVPIHDIITLPPLDRKNQTYGFLEKMWAYKTIKTLLDKNTVSKNDTIENKAKELALKYSFVTPLTSLVVVKPNNSDVVDDKNKGVPGFPGGPVFASSPGAGFGAAGGPPGAGFGGFAMRKSSQTYHLMLFGRRGPVRKLKGMAKSPGEAPAYSSSRFPARPLIVGGAAPAPAFPGVAHFQGPPPPSFIPQAQSSVFPIAVERSEVLVDSGYPITTPYYPSTTVIPPKVIPYSAVSWLNQTESEDGLFLQPPSLLGTDVIALNQTDVSNHTCPNGNNCKHFIHCALDVFASDVNEFLPFQCHIDPEYLGVCCPL